MIQCARRLTDDIDVSVENARRIDGSRVLQQGFVAIVGAQIMQCSGTCYRFHRRRRRHAHVPIEIKDALARRTVENGDRIGRMRQLSIPCEIGPRSREAALVARVNSTSNTKAYHRIENPALHEGRSPR